MPITLPNFLARLLLAARPRRRRPRTTARLRLPANATLRADGPLTLLCTHGTLWVTQSNDPTDHLLSARQQWRTPRPGRVVIHALAPATLTLRTSAAANARLSHFLLIATRPRAMA